MQITCVKFVKYLIISRCDLIQCNQSSRASTENLSKATLKYRITIKHTVLVIKLLNALVRLTLLIKCKLHFYNNTINQSWNFFSAIWILHLASVDGYIRVKIIVKNHVLCSLWLKIHWSVQECLVWPRRVCNLKNRCVFSQDLNVTLCCKLVPGEGSKAWVQKQKKTCFPTVFLHDGMVYDDIWW